MDSDYQIVNHNLSEASKKLTTVHNSVADLQSKMRNRSQDFYYRVSLLAGGILSLSITYLGYLASLANYHVRYGELLFGGWICLTITVIASIYRNHFNLDMGHYQTTNVVNRARKEEWEATLIMLQKYPQSFLNLKTPEEINKQIVKTKSNLKAVERGIATNENNEKRLSNLWLICQNTSHLAFPIGVIMTTLFASLNLPVSVSFDLIKMISMISP